MRGGAVGGIAAAAIVAGCALGVVDIPAEPTPAEIFVASEISADPADPALVQVVMRATLDPGVGLDHAPRRIGSDVFVVEDTPHAPSDPNHLPGPTWVVIESYRAPGPEGVPMRFPGVEGLGLPESISMRVRVPTTPAGAIALADGEDLVLTVDPPSTGAPPAELEWTLDLTSSSMPSFRLRMGGVDDWPRILQVASDQIPAEALPLEAELRIRWDRSRVLFSVSDAEAYVMALRSTMVVAWTVMAAS